MSNSDYNLNSHVIDNFYDKLELEETHDLSNYNILNRVVSNHMPVIKTHKITIYWTRHAESCSNFDQRKSNPASVQDIEPKNYNGRVGYGKIKNELNEDIDIDNNVKKILDEWDNKADAMTAFKAPWLYHPNLSFIGMQHAIKLGTDFYKKNHVDVVCVSPTLRAIMTALLAFRSNNNIAKIYIVPFIHEKYNHTSKLNMDYQNFPLTCEQIYKSVKVIKAWLEFNWFSYYDDIEIIDNLLKLEYLFIKQDKYRKYLSNYNNFENIRLLLNKLLNTRKKKMVENYHDTHITMSDNVPDIDELYEYIRLGLYPKYSTPTKSWNPSNHPKPNLLPMNIKSTMELYNNYEDTDNLNIFTELYAQLQILVNDLNPSENPNKKLVNNLLNILNFFRTIKYNKKNTIDLTKELKNKNPNSTDKQTKDFLQAQINLYRKFHRGPVVDLSILKKYDFNEYSAKQPSQFHKFYTKILPELYNNNIINDQADDVKICIISHGNIMRTYFNNANNSFPKHVNKMVNDMDQDTAKHIDNTRIFQEDIDFKYSDHSVNIKQKSIQFDKYMPIRIRSKYYNFEKLNIDVCRTQSIKGVVNHIMYDTSNLKYVLQSLFREHFQNEFSYSNNIDKIHDVYKNISYTDKNNKDIII